MNYFIKEQTISLANVRFPVVCDGCKKSFRDVSGTGQPIFSSFFEAF